MDGITLHGICPAQPLYADGRRTIREAIWFSIRLLPFLKREEFDIIDCQQFPYFPCFSVKLAAVLKKKPFVITWHEVWGDYWYEYLGWKGAFGKITERLVAGLTPNIIAVSGTTAKKLGCLGVFDDVRIIPNGIDPVHIQSVPPSTDIFRYHLRGTPDQRKACGCAGAGVCNTPSRVSPVLPCWYWVTGRNGRASGP